MKIKEIRDIKVVIIGDGTVGKTCLLIQYCKNRFNPKYTPTIFDNMVARVKYQDQMVGLNLWDTAGQEDYDTLRPLSYQETDVFILCFDVMNRTSFKNIKVKWYEEPNANIVLCGTKIDLRDDVELTRELSDKGMKPVKYEEGMKLKEDLEMYGYIETSAKLRRGVDELFMMSLDSCFKQEGDGCCNIL